MPAARSTRAMSAGSSQTGPRLEARTRSMTARISLLRERIESRKIALGPLAPGCVPVGGRKRCRRIFREIVERDAPARLVADQRRHSPG